MTSVGRASLCIALWLASVVPAGAATAAALPLPPLTARTAEGTVQIQIVPAEVAGAKPLVTTFTNAGADVYASYRKVVNIKPGRYVLHVYEQDTSDGEGAAPNGRLFQVSIPFTVTG